MIAEKIGQVGDRQRGGSCVRQNSQAFRSGLSVKFPYLR